MERSETPQYRATREYWESFFDQPWTYRDHPMPSVESSKYDFVECVRGWLIVGGKLLIHWDERANIINIPDTSGKYGLIVRDATRDAFRFQRAQMPDAGNLDALAELLGVDIRDPAPEARYEPRTVASTRGELDRREIIQAWIAGRDARRRGLRSRGGILTSGEAVLGVRSDRGVTTYEPAMSEWRAGTSAHIRARDYVLTVEAPDHAPGWWHRLDGSALDAPHELAASTAEAPGTPQPDTGR